MNESELVVEVYLDILLLVNFVMDFFILWATGKMANVQMNRRQLVFGALCGALYSLVVLFPEWPALLSFLAKITCSLLMVWFAFRPLSWAKYVRVVAYLYGLSFAMGGAVLAAVFLTDSQPGSLQSWNGVSLFRGINCGWLLFGLVVAFFLAYGGINCLKKNWLQQNLLSSLIIKVQDRQVDIPALLDTGNQLIDPVSQKPVIVVEAAALKTLIPEVLWREICREPLDQNALYASLTLLPEEWGSRVSLIPFNSVGKTGGIMVGLRPELVIILHGKHRITTRAVVLGLVNRALSKEGHYSALLHPQILQDSTLVEEGVIKGGKDTQDSRRMEY